MDKKDIKAFFDRLAPVWDESCFHDPSKIETILDYAGISANVSVLDVACGTGVLFPFYLRRNVSRIVGIDLSGEMTTEAAKNFADPHIRLITGDAETFAFEESFDCCVVYSALPHFEDPANLIRHLSEALLPGGRLTVAHSESRATIDGRHSDGAQAVSMGLLPEDELAAIMEPYLQVDVIRSDEQMYVVSGIRKTD